LLRLSTSPRAVLATLCVTVTVSYGALYYAFAVLGPSVSEREGWSLTAMTAGFSAASLVSGIVAIPIGRRIQDHGPRAVMTVGGVLGTIALVGLAAAPNLPMFIVAMALTGVAAGGLFYPPAFATLTHWAGADRVRAITSLTLVAGIASTIFAPLVTLLDDRIEWRWTYLVLAGIVLVITVPLHYIYLNRPWVPAVSTDGAATDRTITRSRQFRMIAIGGFALTLASFASLIALIPLLKEHGFSAESAAWVLGIGGAGQVVGRVFYPALTRRLPIAARTALIAAFLTLPLWLFAAVSDSFAVLIAISIVAGLGRGLFTLVGATIVTEIWGPERYASVNGVLTVPLSLAAAFGPFAGAAAADLLGSYASAFALLGGLATVGAVMLTAGLRTKA